MTVSANNSRLSYNGNGATVAFAAPYFLANTDLKVYVGGALKTLTTDYSVSGAGVSSGGTVTFVTAPPAGTGNVVILRDPDQLQATQLPSNDPFPSKAVETAMDKLTMLVQRCRDLLSRSFTLPDSDTSGASTTVPSPAANMALKWNSSGTGLTNSTYDPDAGTAAAASSASAAAASATSASGSATAAAGSATAAGNSATAAAASAAALPNVSGGANTVPVINGTATGWLYKTAAQFLTFLGGNAANGPVILDGTGKLPAVDGSQLTGISAGSRQTVLSGPVDSSGLPAFGGATGSATVTAAGTLKATAAAGGDANYSGSIVNPSWTGLNTNGTMYLYLDITSAGVVTTGSTTLAPTYQWGGAYSTINGQNTFNIQEATMKAGNGSVASQVYRVFVGEVTVAGGVVTAITWYALMGRYDSGLVATLPGTSTAVSLNHNIGIKTGLIPQVWLECVSAELGYSVGDRVYGFMGANGSYALPITPNYTSKTVGFGTANGTALMIQAKTAGTNTTPTAANWKYGFTVNRGW